MTGNPPPTPPTPGLLEESNELLREMQKLLGAMGVDERRKTPQFERIMTKYKELGTNMHEARKRLPPKPPPPKAGQQVGYGPTALGRARTAPSAIGMAALSRPRPPV